MIIELTKENIHLIENTFISKDYVLNELKYNPFARILLLQEKNKIIGYVYYSNIYERIEINQIEIEKSKRNQGFGNKLIKEVINKEKKDITLEVKKDNYPAINLYKKNNFIAKAIRKNYYNGVDGILYERKRW